MDSEAQKFWNDFEAETGERVEDRTLGRYYEPRSGRDGLWGLLILTDRSFRFRYFPSRSWFETLFKGSGRSASQAPDFELQIPRAAIAQIRVRRRGLMEKLFAEPWLRFTMLRSEDSDGGAERELDFAIDPGSNFITALGGAAAKGLVSGTGRPSAAPVCRTFQ